MPLTRAYLSAGSNLGDRAAHLAGALRRLRKHPKIPLLLCSGVYETEPQDVSEQPWFLNLVALVETELDPKALLSVLQEVERERGREREGEVRRGPRVIDLDILFFGNEVINAEYLTVPHARLLRRRFVLEPLLEIAPDLVHPVTRRLVAESLKGVGEQVVRRVLNAPLFDECG